MTEITLMSSVWKQLGTLRLSSKSIRGAAPENHKLRFTAEIIALIVYIPHKREMTAKGGALHPAFSQDNLKNADLDFNQLQMQHNSLIISLPAGSSVNS